MYNYGNTDYSGTGGFLAGLLAASGVIIVISIVIGLISLISQWIIYKKAGKKGWESIVPIYNIIVLLQIVELPVWYIALFFVPFANIYAMIKIYIELAHKFGKSTGFGIATALFPIICLPILAFGKNNAYNGGNSTVTQVNNSMPTNQYNPTMPFPNELNSGENNNTNEAEPIMFNQNINTQINPIPASQDMNSNNVQVTEHTFTNPESENVINPINLAPQNNMFETPNINSQPEVNATLTTPSMEQQPVDNTNNMINPTIETQPTPVNTFVYNTNVAPVQEPQITNEMPIPQAINGVQPQANVIPGIEPTQQPTMPSQSIDNNQNNTTM